MTKITKMITKHQDRIVLGAKHACHGGKWWRGNLATYLMGAGFGRNELKPFDSFACKITNG